MRKRKILSLLLSFVLALSCIGSLPVKAATNEMSVASVLNFSTVNGDWRFNFNMEGTWPSDGEFEAYDDTTLNIEIKDAAGNVLDTPKADSLESYKNGDYWLLCIWGTYTKNNVPQAGDTITIASGQMALASDASKNVNFTQDCVLKWNAATSAWSVAGPEVECTDVNIIDISSTNIGTDSGGKPYWDLYLKTDADVPGENWGTTYNDLIVMVNGAQVEATIKRANKATQLNVFIWGEQLSTTPEVGTLLTFKAGKATGYSFTSGTSIGTGINLMEDFVLEWDGSAWVIPATPIVYTDFKVSGLNINTRTSGSIWQSYFDTDATLPGTAWATVGGVQEKYSFNLEIDGKPVTALVKKASDKMFYLELPMDELPVDSAKAVTIKAGSYDSNVQSIGLNLTEDFTFYANPYGWTTTPDSFTTGITFRLDAESQSSKTANGFILTTSEDDGVTPDGEGWTSRIYPVYEKQIADNKQVLYFEGENGVFKNGVYQAVKLPLVKLGTHSYYVAMSDVGLAASAGDSYTIQGGFADPTSGKFIKFETITVQWDGSAWTTTATGLVDTGVTYDVNSDGAFNLKDLMRLGRYLQDGATPINNAQMDISANGTVDAEDKIYIRHILVGSVAHLPNAAEMCDFVVDVESGREPVILQLSDTQIIDAAQQRSADRLGSTASAYWATDRVEECCYDYLTETINATNPDLILLTGDLVYGEFDDNGTAFTSLVNFMETFEIPWAPVFGNHEGETALGIDVYCDQLEAAEYCLFKQRELTGNGNYSVGIRQDNEIKRVFFMLDSNGCGAASAASLANGHTITSQGFGADQIEWYTQTAKTIKAVSPATKLSFAFHIQIAAFEEAYAQYGFDSSKVTSSNILAKPINIDLLSDKKDGDFGYLGRGLKGPWDPNNAIYDGMKELGVDSIFVGHEHCNSASVVYEGIRFQYGQKSSTYDRANFVDETTGVISGTSCSYTLTPLIGGTVMSLAADGSIVNPYIYLCENAGGKINWDDYKEIEGEVNGLQYGTDLTSSVIGVVKAEISDAIAWKCVANSQEKVYINTSLLEGKTKFTFSVYIPEESVNYLALPDKPLFAIRVKPNDSEPTMDGNVNGYIEYSTKVDDANRKLEYGKWQTFTVDVTGLSATCTEFAFNIAAGNIIYLKDVAFE